jgi:ABC-type bacteriocin/lantibiotic exporter with double-glycine peptidase domain
MKGTAERIGSAKALQMVARALKISYETRGFTSALVSILGFGMAFLPLLISTTLRSFTDMVQNLYVEGAELLGETLRVFAVLASLYILQTLFSFARNYYSRVDTVNVHRYIKERIIRCTCDVKYKYIDNFDDFQEKIAFADTYAGQRVASSMQAVTLWLQNVITFVSIVVVLSRINVWIVVLLIATCLPAAVLSYMQKDEDYRNKTKFMKEGAFVIRYFHDTCDYFTQNEVRFFGIFDYIKKKWRDMAGTYIDMKNAVTRKHVLYNSVADLLRNSVHIAVLLIVVRQIFENPAIGLGVFMLVLTMAGQLQEITTRLFVDAAQFAADIGYMKDFFDLDDLEYERRTKDEEPFESADIRLEDVDFTYPNTTRRVLQGLNVTIRQGEKIAVVGENGSGKTTFVNLLCGMHEPDSGSITVNGKAI